MWAIPVWYLSQPTRGAFGKKNKKERKNNFILFIGWMTRALETGLVRIRTFTPHRCWFGAASNYKCLCMRAYIYYVYTCVSVRVYVARRVWVCVCVYGAVRARILYTSDRCVRVYLLSEHHFTVNFTHTHTKKQPAYGRHRKTYFPLKTYNAGVRRCDEMEKKRKHHKIVEKQQHENYVYFTEIFLVRLQF